MIYPLFPSFLISSLVWLHLHGGPRTARARSESCHALGRGPAAPSKGGPLGGWLANLKCVNIEKHERN